MKALAKIQFFFIISILGIVFLSCDPNETLPPETVLEYKNYQLYADSTSLVGLNLQVHFQKGNGNIGLQDFEIAPPYIGKYAYNLYVYVFDKQLDGTYKPMQTLSLEPEDIFFAYRIPILNADRKSSIRGMLDIGVKDANFEIMQWISKRGIVRFEVYMYDRDLVQSNTVITPDIQIR